MDEALAWKRGCQVVPNRLWVFRLLTTTPSSWWVSSDWSLPLLCPLSCARGNKRLSLMLLPVYERLLSSSGLLVQHLSINSTQFVLGILDIQLPPSSAMLSTPCPGSLGQVAGICLFSSLQLPHSPLPTVASTPPG